MKKKWIKCAAVAMVMGWIAPIGAAPIVSPQGVSGLDVGGVPYNISIGDANKTVAQIYGGLGLILTPDPILVAINSALISLFNMLVPIPSTTFFDGCDSSIICIVLLPTYDQASGFGGVMPAIAPTVGSSWFGNSVSGFADGTNYSSETFFTYGTVSAAVPLPGTVALFSLGLGLLGLRLRRKV